MQKYKEAIDCYNAVLCERPENTLTLYNKASSLIRMKKIDEGINILKKVIESDFSYKAKAKYDVDFSDIKTNNEFKKMIL